MCSKNKTNEIKMNNKIKHLGNIIICPSGVCCSNIKNIRNVKQQREKIFFN